MICNGFVLISNYLNSDYELKLIVSKNDRGIDLPAISVFTSNNVFFDKRKILQYFDLSREYTRLENEVNLKWDFLEECRRKNRFKYYQGDPRIESIFSYFSKQIIVVMIF